MANPDGAAHGLSVTNALGEVPRCRFGMPPPASRAAGNAGRLGYLQAKKPVASVEFHWHYPAQQPARGGGCADRLHAPRRARPLADLERAGIVTSHLATLSHHWQVHLMDPEAQSDIGGVMQDWRGNLMQVLVRQFGTSAYVYQNAAADDRRARLPTPRTWCAPSCRACARPTRCG